MCPPDGRIAIAEDIVGFSIINNECATSHAQQMTITFVVPFYPFFSVVRRFQCVPYHGGERITLFVRYTGPKEITVPFKKKANRDRACAINSPFFHVAAAVFIEGAHVLLYFFCRITKIRTHAFLPRVSKSNTLIHTKLVKRKLGCFHENAADMFFSYSILTGIFFYPQS